MDKKFQKLMEEFQTIKEQLSEDYLFNGGEEMPMQDEGQPMPQEGESEEEKAMHAQDVIRHEPIIAKIRETAIEGLKKYADNPTSSIYAFFKKVFLESDKVLTGDGSSK